MRLRDAFLERIRTRAELRRRVDEPARKGICNGSLSTVTTLPIGTGVAQLASAQVASRNRLWNTYEPVIGGGWAAVAGGTISSVSDTRRWDANFIPQQFNATGGGSADLIVNDVFNTSGINTAFQYTVQGLFTTYPNTSFQVANQSTAVRLNFRWSDGVTTVDNYVDFNPVTGSIIGTSGNLLEVQVELLSPELHDTVTATTFEFPVYRVSFTTTTPLAGTSSASLRLTPSLVAATASVVAGGFQIELGAVRSDFIPTPLANENTRRLGTIPRLNVDRSLSPIGDATTFILTGSYTYIPVLDEGRYFAWSTNTGSFLLPSATIGEWCRWSVDAASGVTLTIDPTTAGNNLLLPDGTAVASLAITPASGRISGLLVSRGAGVWELFYDSQSQTAGSLSGSLTATRIPFASGSSTLTDSSTLTYSATAGVGMALNNLLNISGASGGQVQFPATQNASAGANTLDDYEEGTFTPNVGGTATYTTQAGAYTKVGNRVLVNGELVINAIGTGSGDTVSGFPFTSSATVNGFVISSFASLAININDIALRMAASGTTALVHGMTVATGASSGAQAIFANSAGITFSGSYGV